MVKEVNQGGKGGLPKSYKKKHIKRNKVKEAIAKFDDVDRYFNKLIDMFNEGFKKLNKSIDPNESMETKISSLKELNSEGVKKKRIKEVMEWYLNPENMCTGCMPKINSVKEFCENFHQVEAMMDEEGDD